MGGIMRESECFDFAFVFEKNRILVHKWVLAARSSVFRSLFIGKWRYKDEIAVPLLRMDAFMVVVEYIYTGSANAEKSAAEDVITIARRFGLSNFMDAVMVKKFLGARVIIEDIPKHNPSDSFGNAPLICHREDDIEIIEELYDLKIEVDSHVFYCHKEMLTKQTPYFDVMFHFRDNTSSENERISEITLYDISYKAFRGIIEYIYTHRINDINYSLDELLDIFVSSHTYLLPLLNTLLISKIHKHITPENSLYILSIADLLEVQRLATSCFNVIEQNFSSFYGTNLLAEFMKSCSLYASSELTI